MRVVIRDDDLCYYSDFSDFENVYKDLNVPVSVSVVPFGVSNHADKYPYSTKDGNPMSVEQNKKLCDELKKGIKNGNIEVMLHGFTHEYKFDGANYIPEMVWRSAEDCTKLFDDSFKLFNRVFGITPKVFISPSDKCSKHLFKYLKKYNLNYCGLINNLSSRPFSMRTLRNYIKRQFSRMRYGYPYCGIMKYNGWKEIQAFQKLDYDYLISIYKKYKEMGFSFVIETHYWQLKNNKENYNNLRRFIDYAKIDGATFCLMSDIFNS